MVFIFNLSDSMRLVPGWEGRRRLLVIIALLGIGKGGREGRDLVKAR